jgi:hypothetical protein
VLPASREKKGRRRKTSEETREKESGLCERKMKERKETRIRRRG